ATSSTPLAAVLLGAGFSPGAILVFLMVGPATNIASLTVVSKILKGWSMAKYILTIVFVSIIFGIVTDLVYEYTGLEAIYAEGQHGEHAGFIAILSSLTLSLFICWYSLRKLVRRIF
ncbi:MAG: permease, partial [candidate division Zixibacteria bacterium]|nr:permease [candidate division Zixibacteria bacterium]